MLLPIYSETQIPSDQVFIYLRTKLGSFTFIHINPSPIDRYCAEVVHFSSQVPQQKRVLIFIFQLKRGGLVSHGYWACDSWCRSLLLIRISEKSSSFGRGGVGVGRGRGFGIQIAAEAAAAAAASAPLKASHCGPPAPSCGLGCVPPGSAARPL